MASENEDNIQTTAVVVDLASISMLLYYLSLLHTNKVLEYIKGELIVLLCNYTCDILQRFQLPASYL